jgi:Tol biopolymer transport system component
MRVNDDYSNTPLWSPDGSDFAMWNFLTRRDDGAEWFQVTRDGDVHQLTYFSDVYKGVIFSGVSRSWNGRYLAFRLDYEGFDHYKYIVMDLKTQKPQGFCIDPGIRGGGDNSPIWSPDNRYVVFSDTIGHDWFVVDVENQETYQIAHDLGFHPVSMIPMKGILPTPTP